MELSPKFKIGQRVAFVLTGAEAFVDRIVWDGHTLLYECSYWIDGDLKLARHNEYEIKASEKSGFGFEKKNV